MCFMACTAPDPTKISTRYSANYSQQRSKEAKQSKIWLKLILIISNKIVTTIKFGISKSLKWCPKINMTGGYVVTKTLCIVSNVAFHFYHFSKQTLSNLWKNKYLAFFITFCFFVSLAKMVTLNIHFVYKKSAQYRKLHWFWETERRTHKRFEI